VPFVLTAERLFGKGPSVHHRRIHCLLRFSGALYLVADPYKCFAAGQQNTAVAAPAEIRFILSSLVRAIEALELGARLVENTLP
jgi:hypothetical protein